MFTSIFYLSQNVYFLRYSLIIYFLNRNGISWRIIVVLLLWLFSQIAIVVVLVVVEHEEAHFNRLMDTMQNVDET